MPLPPAPTKRAALLPPEAYDAPARYAAEAARKSEATHTDSPLAEKPQAALDFDPRLAGGGEVHPEAFKAPTDEYFVLLESSGNTGSSSWQRAPRGARFFSSIARR